MRNIFCTVISGFLFLFPAIFFASVMEYSWERTAEAYHIIIATNESFFAPVVDDVVWETNYAADLEAGNYALKIAPVSMGIDGRFSEPVRFEVEDRKGNNPPVPRTTILFGAENVSLKTAQTNARWHRILKTKAPLNKDSKLLYGIDNFSNPHETGSQDIDVDLAFLTEGKHFIYYRLVNPLGLAGKIQSREFLVDRTPPDVEIRYDKSLQVGDKTILLPGARISVQAIDKQGPCSLFFSINGKAVRGQVAAAPFNTNRIKILVFSRDQSENERYIIQNCLIDSTGPDVSLYEGQALLGLTNQISQDSTIRIELHDISGVADSFAEIDGIRLKYLSIPVSTLSPGRHSLKVFAADRLNNETEALWSIDIKSHESRQSMLYRLK